ncbi:MAG: DUF1588 domain-containing protein [Myxococcales bacterium]|nr:DUF1588 domain-containing protein [Myxococcales bacterium]
MDKSALLRGVPYGVIVAALCTAAFGCQGDPVEEEEECQTNEEFFLRQVWGPVLSTTCVGCHNAQGQARDTDLVLVPDSQPGFIELNMGTLEQLSRVQIDGEPLILIKPIGGADHGGGIQLAEGSQEIAALTELVDRFEAPVQCGSSSQADFFAGVHNLDELETYRQATLVLAGRLPTPEEETLILENPGNGLEAAMDGLLREEAFYRWLQINFNDRLLTDQYVPNDDAIDLVDDDEFPNARWFEELEEGVDDPALIEAASRWTNVSVAREPLDLITHVVRNDRPFSEILTADYRLVNGLTARVWGVADQVEFDDPLDPAELREVSLAGYPAAGLLTQPMFLNRFPTTDTNRNRHRSRMVYQLFLATDVLKLADRPVDPSQIEDFNPTMYNPACTVCHSVVDPVAGAFQNWDAQGRFRPPEEGWYTDMRPPGFGESTIPHDERSESLEWLADRIVHDRRFALAAIHHMYRALTGQDPLAAPSDIEAPDYDTRLAAYDAQREVFDEIIEQYYEDDENLKTVIKGIVFSPYFRAVSVDARAEARIGELADLGTARLLSPELLDRKIQAITGFPWQDSRGNSYLNGEYEIFYGGIDSRNVVERITAPNGVIANIAQRMAVEMSCLSVPQEFTMRPEDRVLFPFVEPSYVPEDVNGFEIEQAEFAIRQNIQYLHEHVLGERLTLGDPEIERTYQLWYQTWLEGSQALAVQQEGYSADLPWNCRAVNDYYSGDALPEEDQVYRDSNYSIRAWMAVLTYMLSDFEFMHQ